jgi:hypothetical protein
VGRTTRRVIGAAVVLAVASPIQTQRDSFPLSTYPMFARERTSTEPVDTVVAIVDDAIVRLDPDLISGGPEVVTAAVHVSREVREGRATELCAAVADRDDHRADRYEVTTELYDSVEWFSSANRIALERIVHARCE